MSGLPAADRQGAVVAAARRARAGTPVREALQGAVTAIAAAGCETPRLDAEVLLAAVLGVGRERLLSDGSLELAGPSVHAFRDAVRRRSVLREPVAYIVGRRGFRRLELSVDGRALVPRPESELLVEVALELPEGASVLDVCTGSGAIALALKDEREDLDVWGSDVSVQALALARENAARLRLAVGWLRADLLQGVPDEFDALIANPPYVTTGELAQLAPEIMRHEPRAALDGGADGLAVIGPLVRQMSERERASVVALEVGAGQAEAVVELMGSAGFSEVRCEQDLAGIKRVVIGGKG
jgi:release factor glutamine methyltransferase